MKASKDKIDAEKPVVLEVVLLKGKTEQVSFYAGQIAAAAISTFSPKEALGRQEVTKGNLTVLEYGDLITVGLLKDVKAVPIVVDVNYPMEDAIALSKEVKDLAKLKREVEDLSVKVKAELDAVWPENGTKSKMWAQYEPVFSASMSFRPNGTTAGRTPRAPLSPPLPVQWRRRLFNLASPQRRGVKPAKIESPDYLRNPKYRLSATVNASGTLTCKYEFRPSAATEGWPKGNH